MNVYRIDSGGEKTWMCANTNIEALKKHEELTDLGLVDFDTTDEITEVPKDQWKDLSIIDIDADKENGEYPSITFEEYMEDAVSVDMIACTVY